MYLAQKAGSYVKFDDAKTLFYIFSGWQHDSHFASKKQHDSQALFLAGSAKEEADRIPLKLKGKCRYYNDSRLLKPVAPTMLGSQKNKTGDRPVEKRIGLN